MAVAKPQAADLRGADGFGEAFEVGVVVAPGGVHPGGGLGVGFLCGGAPGGDALLNVVAIVVAGDDLRVAAVVEEGEGVGGFAGVPVGEGCGLVEAVP